MKPLYFLLFVLNCLLFCHCRTKKEVRNPSIEFNLFVRDDLKLLYNFLDCESQNKYASEISFLEINNQSPDTVFVTTYKNGKSLFAVAHFSTISKSKREYQFYQKEPFYPASVLDTILPSQRKIYPFYIKVPPISTDEYLLIEPNIFVKRNFIKEIKFDKKLAGIKPYFVAYKLVNGNLVKSTDEFITQFEVQ